MTRASKATCAKASDSHKTQKVNAKKYTCSICFKKFGYKDSLKVHQKSIHEGNLNFACSVPNCTKKYINQFKLSSHLRSHNKVKLFNCIKCNKPFSTKGNLTSHMKLHSERQYFICTLCTKRFSSKGNLSNHINLIHYNLKKHCCTECSMKFGRVSSLNNHKLTHSKHPLMSSINQKGPIDNSLMFDEQFNQCKEDLTSQTEENKKDNVPQSSCLRDQTSVIGNSFMENPHNFLLPRSIGDYGISDNAISWNTTKRNDSTESDCFDNASDSSHKELGRWSYQFNDLNEEQ